MKTRIVSAIIGAGLFLVACFAGALPFALAVTALVALGLWEWYSAYKGRQSASKMPMQPLLAAVGLIFPLMALLVRSSGALQYAGLLALLVLGFGIRVFHANRTGATLERGRAYYGLIGMAYIGMLFSSLVLLRDLPGHILVNPFGVGDRGAWLMLFVAVCVWATDTFAYLVGRSLGRHKLAPRLSPGKTVEGFLGGLIGAVLAGMAFATWIHLPLWIGGAMGGIAGVAGPLGDLFESALKREIGLKDFGRIMPGHGGILDRFDSLLFVTPLAYLLLQIITEY